MLGLVMVVGEFERALKSIVLTDNETILMTNYFGFTSFFLIIMYL